MTRIDFGVVALVADLRGHERPAAEELGQGKKRAEEPKVIDASPAAITLTMICTRKQLEEMERRGLGCNWNWNWSRRPQHECR